MGAIKFIKKGIAISLLILAASSIISGQMRTEMKATAAESSDENLQQNFTQPTYDSGIDMSMIIEPGSRVAVVSKNVDGPFWKQIESGMKQALEDVNDAYDYDKADKITMTFEGASDELDVETQINTLDAVIAENPMVLCMCASDMDSCQAQLEAARENGIPVVVFDSNVLSTDLVDAYRGSDNQKIGQIAADKMAEALPEGGEIAVFGVQQKTQTAVERVTGFMDRLDEYEGFHVVEIVYQDQVEDFKEKMQSVFEEHPNLAGVFCENDETSSIYLEVSKKNEDGGVVFIGVDGSKEQIDAIKDGREYGVVSQNPYEMGYQTMIAALHAGAENDCEVEKTILLEPVWLDQSNVEETAYERYLY